MFLTNTYHLNRRARHGTDRKKWMDSSARETEELEDPENWDFDAVQIQPPVKHPGAIVSVEFNRSEFDQIGAAARQRGVSLTKVVKDAALQLGVWRD